MQKCKSITGTTINAGAYVSGVRTYTYKGAGPVYYDMVYTSNARGQSEKTCFIDADDSTTRTTSRYYTWRDRVRRITHPDANSLDYTWDDHLRMTAEKLDGDTEKYEYDYCLCGAVKRQRYIYTDSLAHSQTMDWTWTTDKLGRAKKLYHPYEIAVNSGDKYFSLLWEYDKAGRRTVYSDPTYGHTAADTSGWTNHTEPSDETDWVFGEPERYLYGETGGLSAMGRVAGAEVRAGDGEPYFVKRDAAGRIASVIYPNKSDTEKPEYEYRYEYYDDGRLKQTALISMANADTGQYGPEKYVVQYEYDDLGRLTRKIIRDNAVQDSTIRHESSYEYDGMGRLVRERTLKWNNTDGRLGVMQDLRTEYDLGGNPTTVYFYDNVGKAYKETRTYARGYQITGASFSETGTGVTVLTAGAYTYDTNNNLTGTIKADATRTGSKLSYRAQWTFTFDRKNRLRTHLNVSSGNHVRGNLWYDGQGRVWQRWNYNTGTTLWATTLTRYAYNGGALAQEHEFAVGALMGSWVYTYDELKRDYMRQPAGMRQRERSSGTDTDYYMQANQSSIEFKTERDPVSATIARSERNASLDQLPGGTFQNISHLASNGSYIEAYGDATNGYEPLMQFGDRHALPGVGRYLTLMGNNSQGFNSQNSYSSNLDTSFKVNSSNYSTQAMTLKAIDTSPSLISISVDKLGDECTCQDCAAFLAKACGLIEGQSTWSDICGCNGMESRCNHLDLDPCLSRGFTCKDLICGKKRKDGIPEPGAYNCICNLLSIFNNISYFDPIEEAWKQCGVCNMGKGKENISVKEGPWSYACCRNPAGDSVTPINVNWCAIWWENIWWWDKFHIWGCAHIKYQYDTILDKSLLDPDLCVYAGASYIPGRVECPWPCGSMDDAAITC